jgi:hypothetical protein
MHPNGDKETSTPKEFVNELLIRERENPLT